MKNIIHILVMILVMIASDAYSQFSGEVTGQFHTKSVLTDRDTSMETITGYNNLWQNFPNPCSDNTTVKYSLAEDGNVKIVIRNMIGTTLTTLIDAGNVSGEHLLQANVSNLRCGVYFISMKSGSYKATRKMIVVR